MKITHIDVMRNFYLSHEVLRVELCEKGAYHTRIKKYSAKQLEDKLKKTIKNVKKITEKELFNYDYDWNLRLSHYLGCTWEYKEIELSKCGVWPGMGGLKKEYTTGNVISTKNEIAKILSLKEKIKFNDRRALYIQEMSENVETLLEYVPIIVFKNQMVRGYMHEIWNQKDFKKCTYDIDDGSHRAVAMALKNKTKIMALVGTPRIKNILTE